MRKRSNGDSMFAIWSERARKAMQAAEEEAVRLGHNYLGTEHLLLGLLRVRGGIGSEVLDRLGVSLDEARQAVERVIGRGEQQTDGPRRPTPRLKKVFEIARDESWRFRHAYVGTEHLLLALAREGEGIASTILEGLGATADSIRSQVQEILASTPGERAAELLRRDNVLSCRVSNQDLEAVDLLIEAGICSTRSDAASWLIHSGIEANRALFERLNATVSEIRRLRQQAQAIADELRGGSETADRSSTNQAGDEPARRVEQ